MSRACTTHKNKTCTGSAHNNIKLTMRRARDMSRVRDTIKQNMNTGSTNIIIINCNALRARSARKQNAPEAPTIIMN